MSGSDDLTKDDYLYDFPTLFIISCTVVLAISVAYYFYRFHFSATSSKRKTKKSTVKSRLDQAGGKACSKTSFEKTVEHKQPSEEHNSPKPASNSKPHHWLKTTFKGHGGQVLDFHFSSNAKYLASCSNERRSERRSRKRRSSSGWKQQPMTLLTTITHKLTAMLDMDKPQQHHHHHHHHKMGHEQQRVSQPLRLTNAQLYAILSHYVMTPSQLVAHGYPMEVAGRPGKALVPASNCRSTNSSAGTSSDGEDSEGDSGDDDDQERRLCCRCNTLFSSSQQHLQCQHHWGKLMDSPYTASGSWYTCCRAPKGTPGCTRGEAHVTMGKTSGLMDSFVRTSAAPFNPLDGNYGVYGIDCEMCFTTHGLELAKLTVVLPDGRVCYETHVRPSHAVVDYNTRFSGLTPQDLEDVTCTLEDVQRQLLHLFSAETILVGHGLENDLRALRLVHSRVVDTAALFPHYSGLPYRRSLRSLAGAYLKKNIQASERGHDSREDAHAAVELVLCKVQADLLARRF